MPWCRRPLFWFGRGSASEHGMCQTPGTGRLLYFCTWRCSHEWFWKLQRRFEGFEGAKRQSARSRCLAWPQSWPRVGEATLASQSWEGHSWQGDGRKLQRRFEGFEGAKRQARNGKEASARSRCLAWPHSWPRAGEATAGKATAGSCREGSRVLRGPKGSLGTVRKLLCEAAAWRGHTVGPELGRPRWQGDGWKLQRRFEGFEGAKRQPRNGKEVSARSRCLAWPRSWPRAGEATLASQSWGGHSWQGDGWKLQRRFEGFEGAKRKSRNGKEASARSRCLAWPHSGPELGRPCGRATAGSCREGSGVLRGPNGSLGTVRKLLREAAAWRGHTVGPELERPRWQGDGWKLQRRFEGFEGAKRQSRNGKEASARSRCLAWPHSWPRAEEATLASRRQARVWARTSWCWGWCGRKFVEGRWGCCQRFGAKAYKQTMSGGEQGQFQNRRKRLCLAMSTDGLVLGRKSLEALGWGKALRAARVAKSKLHTRGGPGRRPASARARQGRRIWCTYVLYSISSEYFSSHIPRLSCYPGSFRKRRIHPTRKIRQQRSAWANLPSSLSRRQKFWSCELEEPKVLASRVQWSQRWFCYCFFPSEGLIVLLGR